ncbi:MULTISPECIES: ubiquinol oxidase subunit II [unclassified Sphingobium]|uniref:ubiquinol oxidase subunit II n=1 Tax=unclassified Sphingobium TaxID=2611147 RepID=UPI00076FFE62|nr:MULTISPECIES: ubiquinol oxidase subunit II [unclassified Sphingobium]AMK23784.1 ubiquinol oxidase subunit II [Sphingobium sp. TKS]NML89547.1 ubiquinol oxidase subunit II [Sphingobium sp. TB-6]
MPHPLFPNWTRIFRWSAPILALPLTACNWVVMNPSGDIAVQQRDLILISTALMLLIVIPVMALVVFFAWRYRSANEAAEKEYDPDWDHSTKLELLIWSAPLLIIICLGALTWVSTHKLDPYRPLDRIDAQTPIDPKVKPLTVEVVALDWKWLFIYPELGIATVNELAVPTNVPVRFDITASTVMNSFYIPELAGQIYAMPGMKTQLHAVANKAVGGVGFSANYSGAGFSHMRFAYKALDRAGFDGWVAKVKAGDVNLDRNVYLTLAKPSEKAPVAYFSAVDPKLFDAVVNLCPKPGQRCMGELMHINMMGGAGKESAHETEGLRYDFPNSHVIDQTERNKGVQTAPDAPGATEAPADHSSHSGADAHAQHR